MLNTVYDPLRHKDVPATPEELVRQWFIGELETSAGVPRHMMMSETGFKLGEKAFRADILVYGRDGRPLAVVECKRPEVPLDAEVVRQAMRYDAVLDVRCIILTNGTSTKIYNRIAALPETKETKYVQKTTRTPAGAAQKAPDTPDGTAQMTFCPTDHLPSYEEMLCLR